MIRDVIIPTFQESIPARDWHCILNGLESRNHHPILVIGQNGDDLLVASPAAREADLVFDARPSSDFWTSLYAGAQAGDGAAYMLCPSTTADALQLIAQPQLWAKLEFEMREILYSKTPGAILSQDSQLWLLNSSAMAIVRDAEIKHVESLVESWKWPRTAGPVAESVAESVPEPVAESDAESVAEAGAERRALP